VTEPTIAEVSCQVDRIEKNVNRMIIGMYGSLDDTDSGFIHQIKQQCETHRTITQELLKDKQTRANDANFAKKTSFTAMVGVVIAMIKAFFFDNV